MYSAGVGSASKLRDFDDWQDPRVSTTDDDLVSPYSDSSTNDLDNLRPQDLSKNGTYVIRRGRKKERKLLPKSPTKSLDDETEESRLTEVRRFSNTFDNIKSLLKENSKLEGLSEPPTEFANSQTVSQPDLMTTSTTSNEKRKPEPIPPVIEERPSKKHELPQQLQQQQHDDDELEDDEPMKITTFAERTKECNGFTITTSKSLDVSKAVNLIVDEVPTRRSINEHHHTRIEAKIPVNLLIEDHIVKKALNENRRQLEKVTDAIKEIESVKNSGDFVAEATSAVGVGAGGVVTVNVSSSSNNSKRWQRSNGDVRHPNACKRNSFEQENSCERRLLDVSCYDGRQPMRKQQQQQQQQQHHQQPPAPPPHATDITDTAKPDCDFDRRRLNGGEVFSSGRRTRPGDLENHKNDTKQIENVIDAILEDSKNPDFQVIDKKM